MERDRKRASEAGYKRRGLGIRMRQDEAGGVISVLWAEAGQTRNRASGEVVLVHGLGGWEG